MIKNMKAIEYNLFMTILKLLNDRMPSVAHEYGISDIEIPILPVYPAHLTDAKKPSIIVRKVDTNQSKIGFGNVLGQFYDTELRGYVDVVGKRHDTMIQFDVVASTNTDRALFESIIAEGIFNSIAYNEDAMFKLYDFTKDMNNPEEIGTTKLIGDPKVVNVMDSDASNTCYVGAIRHNFSTIQTVIPKQEHVDLSKWIKQTYKIKL